MKRMAHTDGYHRLAHVLDQPPNVPALRRFGSLNLLNLLYLQAELVELEADLQNIAREDADSGDATRQKFAHSAQLLQESAKGIEDFQWVKMLEIREKLKNYSKLAYPSFRTLSAMHGKNGFVSQEEIVMANDQ